MYICILHCFPTSAEMAKCSLDAAQPRTLVSLNINATIPTWQTTLNTHVVVPTNTTKTHVNVNAGIQVRFPGWSHESSLPQTSGFCKVGSVEFTAVVNAASHQVWTNITSSNEGRKYWRASEYVDVQYLLVFFADPDHCTLIPTPFVSPSDSSRGTPRHRRGKIIAKNRELCTRRYCKLLSTSTGSCYIQQSCDAASAPTWLPEVSLWPRPPLHHFLPLRKLLHTDVSGEVAFLTPRAQTCTNRTISQQITDFPRHKHFVVIVSWSTSVHFFTARK